MSYKEKKEHEGKTYRGMRVGGRHRWRYADGTWREEKATPDRWAFSYAAHKHRHARAPQGSGAEPGSGYHWLILAHQWVEKEDANTYATFMEGEKRLIAFRKPAWEQWNTQFGNQPSARERTVRALEEAGAPHCRGPLARGALRASRVRAHRRSRATRRGRGRGARADRRRPERRGALLEALRERP